MTEHIEVGVEGATGRSRAALNGEEGSIWISGKMAAIDNQPPTREIFTSDHTRFHPDMTELDFPEDDRSVELVSSGC
jgi:hypothetical protein